jgi:hypothetical protein
VNGAVPRGACRAGLKDGTAEELLKAARTPRCFLAKSLELEEKRVDTISGSAEKCKKTQNDSQKRKE